MYAYKNKLMFSHFWEVINVRNKTLLIAFGAELRKVRKAKKVTQKQLAFDADVSLSQISRLERGLINPTISTCFAISKTLGISLKTLFDFEVE